jgi:hypothetical protein
VTNQSADMAGFAAIPQSEAAATMTAAVIVLRMACFLSDWGFW